MGWPAEGRGARAREAGEPASKRVQAIRHARGMGDSSPMAGEEWKEGARAPPWAN